MKVTARIQDLEEMESDWVAGELRSDLEKTKMESWMVGGEGEEELTDGLSYLEPEGDWRQGVPDWWVIVDQDRSSWVEAVHSCAIAVVVVVAAAGVQMMEFVPAAEEVQMTAEVEEVEE
jgi:hypothetical protein